VTIVWTLAGLALALVLAGCRPQQGGARGRGGMVMQVVTMQATARAVAETVPLVGNLLANEYVEIKSETDGIIQAILFTEGQRVEKGELLVQLDETKLAAMAAEAEARFKLSQANFDRSQQLFKDKLVSSQEFDQMAATFEMSRATLELMKRQLRDTRITAPFGGVLGARQVSPGQVITKSTVLTTLVDLDPMKVEVSVPERFASQVREGQTLELSVVAYANRKFSAKVYFVAAQLDPSFRTALVKALAPNPGHALKPGMFATLELSLTLRDNAIVVPEVALMFDGDNARVFLVDEQSRAQLRPVKLGLRLPGLVEIVSGLNGGERVVVEGVQKVVPGAPLKVVSGVEPAPVAGGGGPAAK
jgi:membrane fusion protein (multidrug efflux system)